MDELLNKILSELSDIKQTMATKQEVAEVRLEMAEFRQEVTEIKQTMATKQEVGELRQEVAELRQEVTEIKQTMATKQDLAEMKELLYAYHLENIAADEKLLDMIRTTNDRLDFQRNKLVQAEEELYLLAKKQ